ncbi:pentatricopeptide repeat-containing protein At1g55890, mitochondrial-like [Chenopodium quinoa]|uniref:pentatricopeptide repeat-containing protein At1g55890, mitochondrial-like n=1 Tax=Chenopodium quinoa TaxID=63459 RepID=UPI000B799F2B|nr:pentatricopeptide repeat-containing protein At1g55890, mitochondrial-like [Chenopodium quinoa]
MSKPCARLHSFFTKTAANTIKPKFPKVPKTREVPKVPKPTKISEIQIPIFPKQQPLIALANNQVINKGVRELLDERDTQKLVEKFNFLSPNKYFRQKYKIYDYIIHRLVLANQISLVEDTLESQKEYINGEGFAARIMYLYGKAGLFDHARKLFDELPQRGLEQNAKTFNALLVAAYHCEDFDKVYELFRELPSKLSIKPSTGCYNVAAQALCKLGLIDEAVSLLDKMEHNGVKPCVITYNTLLGVIYEKGEFDEGEKLWERMIKSGVVPSVISYDFKLHRLVKDGKISEARELFMELETSGIKPNAGSYNALILGACKNDDLDEVRRWYNELLNDGCAPNKATLNTIIPFLCDKVDYGLVFQVCKRMFRRQCTVDESLLQKVVDALAKNSMMKEAEILVGLGKSNSYHPYNLVLPPTGIMGYFSSSLVTKFIC